MFIYMGLRSTVYPCKACLTFKLLLPKGCWDKCISFEQHAYVTLLGAVFQPAMKHGQLQFPSNHWSLKYSLKYLGYRNGTPLSIPPPKLSNLSYFKQAEIWGHHITYRPKHWIIITREFTQNYHTFICIDSIVWFRNGSPFGVFKTPPKGTYA